MKILQVLPALESGGVEKGTLEIAEALVDAGHESWVLSAGGRLVPALTQYGSQHITWDIGKKSPTTLLQVRRLRRWIEKNQFDIIHLRSRMPAWIIWLAWRKMSEANRPKLVSTVHGLHSVSRYSEIVTCGEKVIAVSQTTLDYITLNYPKTPRDKLHLIYRGVNPADFPRHHQPDAEWTNNFYAKYPSLKDRFIVTLPGRLTRLKGHNDLLSIVGSLINQIPSIAIIIVGAEDKKRKRYAEELYDKVAANHWENHVYFLGHQTAMKEIYALSDCVLSLSTKPESFGRTVLEALSLGTKVIGYDHGGVGEILSSLFSFGRCEKGNTQQVEEKIMAIFNDRCREEPLENTQFLLDTMKKETLSLYGSFFSDQ